MGSNGNGPKLQLCLLGLARIALFKPNQLVNGPIHFRAEKMGIYTMKWTNGEISKWRGSLSGAGGDGFFLFQI
jgi:hypothetical protein